MQRERLPFCAESASFREVVQAITRGRLGPVLVGTPAALAGIITDGDIRRAFERHANPMNLTAADIMSARPRTVDADTRLAEAESWMRELRVQALVALDARQQVCGVRSRSARARLERTGSRPPDRARFRARDQRSVTFADRLLPAQGAHDPRPGLARPTPGLRRVPTLAAMLPEWRLVDRRAPADVAAVMAWGHRPSAEVSRPSPRATACR